MPNRVVFFFARVLKINARGGRETEKLIIVPIFGRAPTSAVDSLPYCYYYLRVLYFANFCDLEKIAKLSTRKNFYQHIRHHGTITICVMIFHFGSGIIFLF